MLNCIEQIKKDSSLLDYVFAHVSFLRDEYPGFTDWFYNKVIPGLSTGERKIFVSKKANNFSGIQGVLILKNTEKEKKICTLFVDNHFRFNGLGSKFIDVAFNELNTAKPIMTVTESKVQDFSKLLKKFNFTLFDMNEDFYQKGDIEYSYNGHLYLPKELKNHA